MGFVGTQRRMRGPIEVLLSVHVRAVVRGELQRVVRSRIRAELRAHAHGVVIVRTEEPAVERLGRVRAVVVGVEPILERVVVRLGLQIRRFAQLRLGEHRRVLDVPVRPAPVAVGRHRRVVDDVQRRTLFALLVDVVEGVLVGVVRRPPGLDVVARVGGVGAQSPARGLERVGRGRVVARQRPVIPVGVVRAPLEVVLRLASANHRVAVPPFGIASPAGPDAAFRFEGFHRLPRHEIDGAAHRARAVQHRCVALLNLDLGDVRGQKPAEVEPIVRRQIDPHTIDAERDLPAAEPAHEDVALVAPPVRVEGADHAGHDVDGVIERLPIQRPDLFARDHGAADTRASLDASDHDDLPHVEHVIRRWLAGGPCVRILRGRR